MQINIADLTSAIHFKMSDLQRSFVKPKLPKFAPLEFNEADEEEEEIDMPSELPDLPIDDDSSSASSASSTGTIIPSSNQNLFARPQGFVLAYCSLFVPG